MTFKAKCFKFALPAAIALAIASLSGVASAQSAAQKAVDAAKKMCNGKTITIVWEAGLQSLDPKNFSGPMWEKLTTCKISVVEVSTAEMFTKIMQEYRAGTGAYDALNVIPAWMPDLVQAGALEQLDAMVDKYGFRAELQKIAPTYRDNQMKVNGKIYGFPDDGDVFLMYYRKDIFADPAIQKAFKAKLGYDLAPPKTWKQFGEIGQFLTDTMKDKGVYGAAQFREPGYGNFMFQERFRNEGGKFFDANMKAQINNPTGVKVLKEWLAENKFMPAGVEKFGFVENLATFVKGQSAMTISWPPYGRFRRGISGRRKGLGLGAEIHHRRQGRLCLASRRTSAIGGGFCTVGRIDQQEQRTCLSLYSMAEQRRDLDAACAITLCAARSVPRFAFHQQRISR